MPNKNLGQGHIVLPPERTESFALSSQYRAILDGEYVLSRITSPEEERENGVEHDDI